VSGIPTSKSRRAFTLKLPTTASTSAWLLRALPIVALLIFVPSTGTPAVVAVVIVAGRIALIPEKFTVTARKV